MQKLTFTRPLYSNINPYIVLMHSIDRGMNLYRYAFKGLYGRLMWLYIASPEQQPSWLEWDGIVRTDEFNQFQLN